MEIRGRSRQGCGVQADDSNALAGRSANRILKTFRIRKNRYSVGLEGDRLVEACHPARRATLAVDHRNLPAQFGSGFLHIESVLARDVVLLISGQVNDELV